MDWSDLALSGLSGFLLVVTAFFAGRWKSAKAFLRAFDEALADDKVTAEEFKHLGALFWNIISRAKPRSER